VRIKPKERVVAMAILKRKKNAQAKPKAVWQRFHRITLAVFSPYQPSDLSLALYSFSFS